MISPYAFPGIKRVDLPVIYTRIAKQSKEETETPITSEMIFNAIEYATEVRLGQIKGVARQRHIVAARHIYCFYARTLLGWPLNRIGDSINRDHTTVINALKCYSDHYQFDPHFKKLSSIIKHRILALCGEELVSL